MFLKYYDNNNYHNNHHIINYGIKDSKKDPVFGIY